MFHVLFDTTLKPSHPEFRSVAGALISCCVRASRPEDAVEEARRVVDAEDYVITEVVECRAITREEVAAHPDWLASFNEAARSGVGLRYQRWPV